MPALAYVAVQRLFERRRSKSPSLYPLAETDSGPWSRDNKTDEQKIPKNQPDPARRKLRREHASRTRHCPSDGQRLETPHTVSQHFGKAMRMATKLQAFLHRRAVSRSSSPDQRTAHLSRHLRLVRKLPGTEILRMHCSKSTRTAAIDAQCRQPS